MNTVHYTEHRSFQQAAKHNPGWLVASTSDPLRQAQLPAKPAPPRFSCPYSRLAVRPLRKQGNLALASDGVDAVANFREQDDDFEQRPLDSFRKDGLAAVGLEIGLFEFTRLKVPQLFDINGHG
jgi:hypothetical protein